jgi:hypothetical protein
MIDVYCLCVWLCENIYLFYSVCLKCFRCVFRDCVCACVCFVFSLVRFGWVSDVMLCWCVWISLITSVYFVFCYNVMDWLIESWFFFGFLFVVQYDEDRQTRLDVLYWMFFGCYYYCFVFVWWVFWRFIELFLLTGEDRLFWICSW